MVFQRYKSYKPAKSKWLNEVPSHWKLLPGMAVLKENKVRNIGMVEEVVLSLSYGKVIVKPPEKLTGLVPESFETYQVINPNDIIIRPTDLQNDQTSLRTGISKDRGIITSAYICLRPDPEHNPTFIHYLLHAYDLIKVYYGMGSGLRQNLDFRDFKRLELCIPPREEQDRIANFLDQKTAEIDEAIAKKQRLIELLKEQKAILINQAVTKGLNSDVPMRDSGVEWIGEVPAHWDVCRIKHGIKKITKGTTPSTEGKGFVDEGIRYFKAENIVDNEICLEPAYFIDDRTDRILSRSQLKSGDVLFVIAGATIGKTAVLSQEHTPSNTNQAVCLLRPSKFLLSEYLHLWLQSNFLENYIRVNAVQSAQPNISMEDLGNINMPMPPIKEQQSIVRELEDLVEPIVRLLKYQQHVIDYLLELRSIFISEYITGKIKI